MNDTYTTADTLCDWALALQVEHQDRAEAQRLYEQALTIFPQHYRAAFLLADLHALAEQLEPAATYAKLAHRIAPSASSQQKVIEAVVKLAFHHAQCDAVPDLLTDFGYLLSVGAHEEATALFAFIKEQYSSDPAIASAMAEVLTKQDRPDWISEWNAQDQACPIAIIQPPQQSAVTLTEDALCAPLKIDTVWINLTSRCNLRCVYCTVGTPGYVDADLSTDSLEKVMRFIRERRPGRVSFGCYAETTTVAGWHRVVKEVIDMGTSVNIISNLARVLTDEEIDVFSQCNSVQNSVDTIDIERLKALRKGADLRTILYNIQRIRGRSIQHRRSPPWLSWICVPTPENMPYLLEYVSCAIACGIRAIDINPLLQFADSKAKIPDLLDLPDAAFQQAYDTIKEAIAFAATHNVTLTLNNQDLFEERAARTAMTSEASTKNTEPAFARHELVGALGRVSFHAKKLNADKTRLCTIPWDTAVLYGNGDILPCTICGTPMGNLADFDSLEAALSCAPLQDWRRNLLRGELSEACTNCLRAPEGSTEELAALIERTRQQQATQE